MISCVSSFQNLWSGSLPYFSRTEDRKKQNFFRNFILKNVAHGDKEHWIYYSKYLRNKAVNCFDFFSLLCEVCHWEDQIILYALFFC